MFGLLKTDFSKLKSERFCSGTFGAKTTELDRFKDAAEKANVIVPPHVSFPLEFFKSALVRSGFLTEAGVYTGKRYKLERDDGNLIEFNIEEKKTIIEAFSRFMNFIVAVRSDELTAKGVGVFSTKFILVSKKTLEDGTIFNILSEILANQFNPSANAFKRRMNMPHGIGIQIMPLAAESHGGIILPTRFYPRLSIAGFTAREKEKAMLNVGFGIGGGVSPHAVKNRIVEGNVDKINIIKHVSGKEIDSTSSLTNSRSTMNFRFITKQMKKAYQQVMTIAQNSGTDVYFELQLTPNGWALTQISSHGWPKIEKPAGMEINFEPYTPNDWVIGSGIVKCIGFNGFYSILDNFDDDDIERFKKRIEGKFAMSLGSSDITIDNFEWLLTAAALMDCKLHHKPFSSHTAGLYREAGIPVINAKEIAKELQDKRGFYVWADELNQKAGIVIPE